MHNDQENEASHLKLAQLWRTVKGTHPRTRKTYLHRLVVDKLLEDDFNVNYKVTIDSENNEESRGDLKDCTALHFLYYHPVLDIDTFNIFISLGADFTLANGNNQTVVHMVIVDIKNWIADTVRKIQFVNSVLAAHVKFRNFTNPRDDNGYTHFHGACILNHVEALSLFLDSGVSANETVNFDAPKYAGYTPLHFALKFNSLRVAEILLSHGANVNARSAKGTSPLDIIAKSIRRRDPMIDILQSQAMIKMLMNKGAVTHYLGWSNLQIACQFSDYSYAERLVKEGADVNYTVPLDSPLYGGFTALHFAAEHSIKVVRMLLAHGADINVKHNQTLFDNCLASYSLKDTFKLLSQVENGQEIVLPDGNTTIKDLIIKIQKYDELKLFLQNDFQDINAAIPSDSPVWPGYTILHLAVTFLTNGEGYLARSFEIPEIRMIINECLDQGININSQNARGKTAIHLAFREGLFRHDILILLINRLMKEDVVPNIMDNDNLSYLHIACEIHNEEFVEKLLKSADPNVRYNGEYITGLSFDNLGPTPLHIVAANKSHAIASILLKHGADLHAPDKNGFTPIHWIIKYNLIESREIANVLINALLDNLEDRVVNGLGYLHVACYMSHVELVKGLLDLGSNVDAVVQCDSFPKNFFMRSFELSSTSYSSFTPLQMAMERPDIEVLDILLGHVADMLANDPEMPFDNSGCLPIQNEDVHCCFFEIMWERRDVQKIMKDRLGLTKLHIACYMKSAEAIEIALKDGFDVNLQIRDDSVIFAGCTPLYLLVMKNNFDSPTHNIESMIKLLLDRGADVTIANADKFTPIHLFFGVEEGFANADRIRNLLLNAQLDFSINPANDNGVTHFHLACFWHEVEVVRKFLQCRSVNVNQPTDYFNGTYAGSTALHLALSHDMVDATYDWRKLLRTVNVLLINGADVEATDAYGDTPLHKQAVLRSPGLKVLDVLISFGGDIRKRNIYGQTPIEACEVQHNTNRPDRFRIFRKYDYSINSWNDLTKEGYIAKVFSLATDRLSESADFLDFMTSLDVRTVDNFGRTAIHNIVAVSNVSLDDTLLENYTYAVGCFMRLGFDVDRRDVFDETALHYAAQMENVPGVEALLVHGADVNIADNSGKSPFFYAIEQSTIKNDLNYTAGRTVTIALRFHLLKMQYLNVEISEFNEDLFKDLRLCFEKLHQGPGRAPRFFLPDNFFSQIELAKTLDVGVDSRSLYDYLAETAANTSYPFLVYTKRNRINHFFQSNVYAELDELLGIIRLQYRKMTTRYRIINPALDSMRKFMGFSFPGLSEHISLYLSNSDLHNLIKAELLDAA